MRKLLIAVTLMLFAGFSAAGTSAPPGRGVVAAAPDQLDIYFIDVEGGQATLFITPAGQSILVDAGWPGFEGRDADRIAAAVKQAGLSRIDYFIATHYHTDHVGGVPQLAAKLPIEAFVDHGPSVESGERPDALFKSYADVRAKGRHIVAKPGDTLPIKGLDVRVVSAGGDVLTSPLPPPGAASASKTTPNPLCADFKPQAEDPGENARSVGIAVTHGRFRMVDLGDLTWNVEQKLACPANVLGPIDLYLTTHHGMNISGPAVLVHAIRPRVAVMNNGARKGGSPETWQTLKASPGLEDVWQLHYATKSDASQNAPETFIANVDETTGHGIKVSAQRDGSFVVSNQRNGHSKTYSAPAAARAR